MSEANWKKISQHFSDHPIKKTKELLCLVTINPYKMSPRFKSWQRISTCSDYMRKYSRVLVVVMGKNSTDGSNHYHVICYLEPLKIPLIMKSKMFNVDIKEWTVLDKTDYVQEDRDQEFWEANDELAAKYEKEGTPYTNIDIYILIGYNRALRDVMLKKPKLDTYALEDLSKYCVKNMQETVKLPSDEEWEMYKNIVIFPNNRKK